MPKGKPWTKNQENKLRSFVEENKSLGEISDILEKSPDAVRLKIKRLGLEVVVDQSAVNRTTTSSEVLPHDLISMEDSLKLLVGALKMACIPGLSKVEVQRLHVVATLSRNYQNQLPIYLKMRNVEKRLFELEEKISDIIKKSPSNSTTK